MPCHNWCPSFSFVSPTVKVSWKKKICEFFVSSVSHTIVVLGAAGCAVSILSRRSDTTHKSVCTELAILQGLPCHHRLLECSVGPIVHLLHSKGSCNIVQRNWRLTAPKVAWLIQRWAQGWDPGVGLLNLSGSSPSFGSCPHCLQKHKPSIWLF